MKSIRVVSWNCSMGLHRKLHALLDLGPELAIIQEVADPRVLAAKCSLPEKVSSIWIGHSKNKGLAVLGFDGWKVQPLVFDDGRYELFLPFAAEREGNALSGLAVWAFNHRAKHRESNRTVDALRHILSTSAGQIDLIAGDFNANVAWDPSGRYPPFQEVVDLLEECDYRSAYHTVHPGSMGRESEATLYWRRSREHRYHVDYAFVRGGRVSNVFLGHPSELWLELSDHVPLVVNMSVGKE